MVFLGHFSCGSFRMPDSDDEWRGHFTLIADAPDVTRALRTFRKLILDAARGAALEDVEAVYLDACIELPAIPKGGMMTWLALLAGEDLGSVSCALPMRRRHRARLYQWGPQPEDEESTTEVEAFVTLPRRRRTRPRRSSRNPTASRVQ
jgi:hypothetical protein